MWLTSVLRYGCPYRQSRANPGAAAGRALDLELPSEGVDAVDEAPQAGAPLRVGAADPVVRDLERETVGRPRHAHAHRARVGVLGDVRERLGRDVERRHLHRLGEAPL